MRRRRGLFFVVMLLATAPAFAQFRTVADRIAAESGMSRLPVPGSGLARLAVRMTHPDGVSDMQLAMFDPASATRRFDAGTILSQSLDPGWQPLVQFHDRRSGEQGSIYAKPSGSDQIHVMIFSTDAEDSVLVELRVDATRLAEIIEDGSQGSFDVK